MKWIKGAGNSEAKKWIRQLSDPSKRKRASDELLRLGAEAAPALIEALLSRNPDQRAMAESMLIQSGKVATPALTAGLQADDSALRSKCARILAETRDPQACPALIQALQDRYFSVRQVVALALGEIREAKTLPALMRTLDDPEPEVRSSALLAIGKFCEPSAFDRMADLLLDDPDLEVRQAAAKALGDSKHPQALEFLLVALRDSYWWYEREGAVATLLEAIVNIGQPAVEPLLEALRNPEGTVRRYAAFLLGRIGDRRAIEALGMALYDMHHEVGHAAAESLAGFGEAGLRPLAEALEHPEAWLRLHAISGLTRSGDNRVVPLLVNMLDDPEREVIKRAIQSLGELQNDVAIAPLKKIAANRADRELSTLARRAIEAIAGT
jgi:HEAT repeat protein